MEYALALLTHGSALTLVPCLESFAEKLAPQPTELLCVVDGPGALPPVEPLGPWHIEQSRVQEGFCAATGRLWRLAAQASSPYIFWLEHDFFLLQPVELELPATLLAKEKMLAQIQFMREAVNLEEKRAGGLYQYRSGQYKKRWFSELGPAASNPNHWSAKPWLEHQAYFTTNPSLMQTAFLASHPFPHSEDAMNECEGKFGIYLIAQGFSFGVWGDGSPLVRHAGRRRGFGY